MGSLGGLFGPTSKELLNSGGNLRVITSLFRLRECLSGNGAVTQIDAKCDVGDWAGP
jgi:hypothetical protein